MNEKQTRPTKKQKELLAFIEQFIGEHGYSPSYREIMNGCSYTSVATVSLHVTSLIKRGHLRKRDYSARSLEVVSQGDTLQKVTTNQITETQEKWLVEQVEHRVQQLEQLSEADRFDALQDTKTLIEALKVLGVAGAAQSFTARITELASEPQA